MSRTLWQIIFLSFLAAVLIAAGSVDDQSSTYYRLIDVFNIIIFFLLGVRIADFIVEQKK